LPRIAPHRLDDDRRVDADFFGLTSRKEMKVGAGDNNMRCKHHILHTQQCFLVGRPVADQGQELLGKGIARHWPKPCSGTACQHDWDDW
jgi:hypothetical protein